MANASANAAKSQGAAPPAADAFWSRKSYENESSPVPLRTFHTSTTMATSMSSDPAMV